MRKFRRDTTVNFDMRVTYKWRETTARCVARVSYWRKANRSLMDGLYYGENTAQGVATLGPGREKAGLSMKFDMRVTHKSRETTARCV